MQFRRSVTHVAGQFCYLCPRPFMTSDEFVAEIYRRFQITGRWPTARALQVELRRHGNIRLLAARAGKENLVCEDGVDGICRLTLRGLRRCPEAAGDLKNYVAVVRALSARYISGGSAEISMNEVGGAIGADAAAIQRLVALFSRDNTYWSSWRGGDGGFVGTPSDELVFLEGVGSLDEIEERLARLDAERREVAALHWGADTSKGAVRASASVEASSLLPKLPMALALRDPRLRAATAHDLEEIARSVQSGAWKSAAILAGSCLEALLLDIWFRREDDAKRIWPKAFPNSVKLSELADQAVRAGLISQEHRTFAGAIQRVRNLVHPLRAAKESVVTPALVGLLLSALRLLNEELGDSAA